jgi:hypothetical protein
LTSEEAEEVALHASRVVGFEKRAAADGLQLGLELIRKGCRAGIGSRESKKGLVYRAWQEEESGPEEAKKQEESKREGRGSERRGTRRFVGGLRLGWVRLSNDPS